MAKSFEQLQNAIIELAAAERITKRVLGELSRDLLEYLVESEDVRPINNLLGKGEDGKFILTPVNWRIACLYFHHFVPFTSNFEEIKEKGIHTGKREDGLVFSKKSKKKWDKCLKSIEKWLATDGTIWSWQAENVETKKVVNYAGNITKAVEKALKGDDDNEPLTISQIMDAVIAAGVKPEMLMAELFKEDK